MPTSRSGGRRRKTPARDTGGFDPVFSGDDNIISGEVLITLSGDATDAMTQSVPLHPAGVMGSSARSLGVDDLDAVLADLGAYDITRLAPSLTGMADAAGTTETRGLLRVEENDLSRSFRVRIDPDHDVSEAVAQLQAVGTVATAEANRWREATAIPNDPQFAAQWGLTSIKAPAAWDLTTGSPSVVVAVIDSGCDLDHPELAPLLLPGFDMVDLGPAPTPKPGWRFEGDFAGRDATPEDEVGHGTHVAGTIACLSNNAAGVAGVSWRTRILPVKALTRLVRISDGRVSGVGSSADIAAAIRWAADHGAHVINMSLGSDGATTVESTAVAYAISRGVVVVAAMGNDGSGNPSFPAAYADVVAVGAIDSADHRAGFSQFGSHIDVAAPGVDILSTYLAGGTTTMSGTSMATPHVAGVAALIKAAKPAATGAEIAEILRSTARPLRDNPADPVPNDRYGFGCVDAQAAVNKALGRNDHVVVKPPPWLHTPVVPCVPVSLDPRLCVVRTLRIGQCFQTVLQPQCRPVASVACPPTLTITIPPPTFRNPGFGQGYDPYGLFGGGRGPAGEPTGGSYQDGYAAGYAAALAQTQGQTGAPAPEAGAAGAWDEPGFTEQLRSVIDFCFPNTVTSTQCLPAYSTVFARGCPPPTVPGLTCPPITVPQTGCPVRVPNDWPRGGPVFGGGYDPYGQAYGGSDPYGQAYGGGYDPYGQNPFEG